MSATVQIHSVIGVEVEVKVWTEISWINLTFRQEETYEEPERFQLVTLFFDSKELMQDFGRRLEGFGKLPAKLPAKDEASASPSEYTGPNEQEELIYEI